jgi:uncharacterized caspase-like protein
MGKNWAIAIGINSYDNLQSLKYAQRDAEVMATWFGEEAKFDRIFLFTENSPPIPANPPIVTQPTNARFRRFLNVQFETPLLNPEDNLWFFFAGHGKRYNDQDYLMFPDSDPTDSTTAISVDYITQRLRRCGADNVVLLLDACRDEGSRGGLGIGEEEHQGVITFYSCTANQQSFEIDELQHGAFTHALLEGLRLQGEFSCATVERLDQYLSHHVPRLNHLYNKPLQNPYLKAEPPRKMYYILLDKVATLKDAETLKYQASQAENTGDWLLAKQLWKRVLALPGVDEDAIAAIERIAVRISSGQDVVRNFSGQDARTTEIILEKKKITSEIDIYKANLPSSTATFFEQRFSKSFPGVRGIEKFSSSREAIMRLTKLLKEPLTLKSDNFKDNPIWWFRGYANSPIIHFENLEDDIILINNEELKINKVIAVHSHSYYQLFVYIETYPMLPSGLYNWVEQDIQSQIKKCGYCCEEFGVYQRKILVKRSEYDDGAAIIDGKIVELDERFTELRVRYLSPHNLVIASLENPLNNPSFDSTFEEIMNNILKGNASIEDLSQAILQLPKRSLLGRKL